MDELRRWYREGLSERIEVLQNGKHDVVEQMPDALETVRRVAQSLRVSGVTYGFPDISDAAHALERATSANTVAAIDQLVRVLETIVETPDNPAKILLVTGDPVIIDEVKERLEKLNRAIQPCRSLAEAVAAIRVAEFSVIVVDVTLPDGDGRELVAMLREDPRSAAVPIIVISGLDSAVLTECLVLGADYYVKKPLDLDRVASLIETTMAREDEITRDVWVDAATGLPNRAALLRTWRDRTQAAARSEQSIVVGLISLDRLGEVSDRHGLEIATRVVSHVGALVRGTLPAHDFVALWGVGALVVVFQEPVVATAVANLKTVAAAVRAQPLVNAGRTIPVTISCGVAANQPGNELDQAIEAADRLTFAAAVQGGDRVVSSETPSDRRYRILVAEDDEVTALHLQALLQHVGFDVVHFPDGAAALKAASTAEADLVLLDVQMPQMGGFEVLERLRSEPRWAALPIVMLTSMGSESDVARAFRLGADDYLVKPFSHTTLPMRLRRTLLRHVGAAKRP